MKKPALDRFAAALLVIDAAAAQNAPLPASAQVLPTPGPAACSIAQALFAPHTALALQHAVGRTSRSMSGHIRRAFRCWHRAK